MLCDGSIFKDLKGATKEQQGSNLVRTWYGDGTEMVRRKHRRNLITFQAVDSFLKNMFQNFKIFPHKKLTLQVFENYMLWNIYVQMGIY